MCKIHIKNYTLICIMLTIDLRGGLGNQLFQICCLLSSSIDNKHKFVIEKKKILYGPIRNYNVYWDNIFKFIGNFEKDRTTIFKVYKEPKFHFNKIPTIPENYNVMLYGYFQSYKYFHHNFNRIKKLLTIDSLKRMIVENNNIDYTNTISIHFRVGDYAQLQNVHPLMTPEYYIRAISCIIEKTKKEDWKILVFCEKDDINIVNSSLSFIKEKYNQIEFVICNHNLKDWEQMLQMSLCQHNIIANSSFSWWGAYLNENKDNIVCAPKKWFGPTIKHNTKDLYLKDWIQL